MHLALLWFSLCGGLCHSAANLPRCQNGGGYHQCQSSSTLYANCATSMSAMAATAAALLASLELKCALLLALERKDHVSEVDKRTDTCSHFIVLSSQKSYLYIYCKAIIYSTRNYLSLCVHVHVYTCLW